LLDLLPDSIQLGTLGAQMRAGIPKVNSKKRLQPLDQSHAAAKRCSEEAIVG